jgi:hypothetical protein
MTTPTHASLASFRMDPTREEEQTAGLNAVIVPGVRGAPGFVSGCWTLNRESSESTVLVTFDSHESASAFADDVRSNAANQAMVGIELLSITVVEVVASADT